MHFLAHIIHKQLFFNVLIRYGMNVMINKKFSLQVLKNILEVTFKDLLTHQIK